MSRDASLFPTAAERTSVASKRNHESFPRRRLACARIRSKCIPDLFRLVAADAKLALQLHRRDPRMVRGRQVRSPEPQPQRHLRLVHHRAGGHRGLRAAALALPHPPSVVHRSDRTAAASPAAEPSGPTAGEQVLPTRLLRGEPLLELHDRQREPGPGHPVKLRPTPDGKDRVCTSLESRTSGPAGATWTGRHARRVLLRRTAGRKPGPRPGPLHLCWRGYRGDLRFGRGAGIASVRRKTCEQRRQPNTRAPTGHAGRRRRPPRQHTPPVEQAPRSQRPPIHDITNHMKSRGTRRRPRTTLISAGLSIGPAEVKRPYLTSARYAP